MGYAHDWVSVTGLDKDEVLSRLGFVDRGEPLDYPRRGDFAWAITAQGRVLIVTDYDELSLDRIAELSRGASLVAARAEGNDCTSSVWGYEDGRQIWSVATEAPGETDPLYDEQVEGSLIVAGDPPSEFAAIRDRHLAERNLEDDDAEDFLFMAPLELAETLGGWEPEGKIGQDLQFFRVMSAGRSDQSKGMGDKPKVNKLWVGLAILLFVIAAYRMWLA